jgi:hypothetical protein
MLGYPRTGAVMWELVAALRLQAGAEVELW